MFSLNIVFYIAAFLLIIPLYLIYAILIRPYINLQFYRRQGIPSYYTPLVGFLMQGEEDVVKHGDYFYTLKQRALVNPRPKAIALTAMHNAQILIKDPAVAKNFFLNQGEYYIKTVEVLHLIRALQKDGVVTAEGQTWKRHRKLISPAFSFEFLRDVMPDIVKTSNDLLDRLKEKDLSKVSILPEMYNITGDVIGKTFLAEEFSKHTIHGQAIPAYLNHLIDRLERGNQSPLSFMLPESIFKMGIFASHRKALKEIKEFRAYVKDLIHQQILKIDAAKSQSDSNKGQKSLSLVELFHKQVDPDSQEAFTEDDLTDEFIALILGGTGNNALLVTFATYFFLKNPQCQQKVMNEVDSLFSDLSNVNIDTLNQMDYTTAFMKETLRIAPPASILFLRTAIKDHDLGGLKVKKGTTVDVLFLANNFDPNYHDDPEVFSPERWLDKDSRTMKSVRSDPYVYTPFSAGPRNCIGQTMALFETKIIFCLFLRKFRYSLTDKNYQMRFDFKFLYEPFDTLYYTLEPK